MLGTKTIDLRSKRFISIRGNGRKGSKILSDCEVRVSCIRSSLYIIFERSSGFSEFYSESVTGFTGMIKISRTSNGYNFRYAPFTRKTPSLMTTRIEAIALDNSVPSSGASMS